MDFVAKSKSFRCATTIGAMPLWLLRSVSGATKASKWVCLWADLIKTATVQSVSVTFQRGSKTSIRNFMRWSESAGTLSPLCAHPFLTYFASSLSRAWSQGKLIKPSIWSSLQVLMVSTVLMMNVFCMYLSQTLAMDDYMTVSTYQDMALTTVKQLGQGHFGVVELCSHDNSSNNVQRRSELVAVKRFDSALTF